MNNFLCKYICNALASLTVKNPNKEIYNWVQMPHSSSRTNKSNSVTTASLVSSVRSAFSLSARVKACECVCLCTSMGVYFHADNRACLSDCASLIIAVISYRAQASTEWLEKKSHFLLLFKLHHTLWQDHLLTKTHGRLIWIYARHTQTHADRECTHSSRTCQQRQTHHLECSSGWYGGIEIHRSD